MSSYPGDENFSYDRYRERRKADEADMEFNPDVHEACDCCGEVGDKNAPDAALMLWRNGPVICRACVVKVCRDARGWLGSPKDIHLVARSFNQIVCVIAGEERQRTITLSSPDDASKVWDMIASAYC